MEGKKEKKSRQANGQPDNSLPVPSWYSSTGILLPLDTVRAGAIENDTRASRISLFGLGGEEAQKRFSSRPQLEPIKKYTVVLTRRGNSNALARFPIIPVLRILHRAPSKCSVTRSY